MSDFCDRAAQHEAELRADALAAQERRGGLAGKAVADSAMTCHICEAGIPAQRRKALPGVQTCVHCQEDLEKGLGHV